MKQYVCAAFLLSFLAACDSGGRIENTKALSKEIRASQIKRVTNTQLVYSADEWGKKITQIASKSLASELEKNPGNAAKLCHNLGGIPVVAALQKEYGVTVELLGAPDLKDPRLASKERELLDAYLYSAKTKTSAGDNLQQLNDSLLVYNAPVAAESVICSECMKGQEVPFAVWRLVFNKKDIIRKLDVKQLNK
jgi:hypothetical protein